MKLQTWITWLCCGAVLITTIVIDILLWNVEHRNIIEEANSRASSEAYEFINGFIKEFNITNIGFRDSDVLDERLQYYFKGTQDEYAICMRFHIRTDGYTPDNEQAYFVFNHTVFTTDALLDCKYTTRADGLDYGELTYQGSHFLIYCFKASSYTRIYHLTDINYIWEKMRNLTIWMVVITIGTLVVMILIVSAVLRRSLRSLKELNETAADIAKGNYDKRVKTSGKSEIAELGTTFNRMAEAVQLRTQTLEESERQKTLFMGNLTHELKTPLAAISGYAQTLLTVKVSEEDREEALLYIDEECKRLERLSKKMLRLLELDSEQKLELQPVMVRQLFERTERLCRKLLETKGVKLICEEHGECFMVDEDLMTEVLVNLVDNANKASRQGTAIFLTAKEHQICVRDTGCGIPKEEQKKILEPFYMIDKSRSRKNGGAGLGLALTALILKRHHVTLSIDSEEGVGTTMILSFPEVQA